MISVDPRKASNTAAAIGPVIKVAGGELGLGEDMAGDHRADAVEIGEVRAGAD